MHGVSLSDMIDGALRMEEYGMLAPSSTATGKTPPPPPLPPNM